LTFPYTSIGRLINSINHDLSFAFNKINLDSISINTAVKYKRGNYDIMAKNETYGLSAGGLLTEIPFAFFLEGRYLRFYSTEKLFSSQYFDTVYINTGLSYSFANIFIIDVSYQYDNVSKNQFTFGLLLTRFISLYFSYLNPGQGKMERAATINAIRFRSPSWQSRAEK
jgi:hypothetical protein